MSHSSRRHEDTHHVRHVSQHHLKPTKSFLAKVVGVDAAVEAHKLAATAANHLVHKKKKKKEPKEYLWVATPEIGEDGQPQFVQNRDLRKDGTQIIEENEGDVDVEVFKLKHNPLAMTRGSKKKTKHEQHIAAAAFDSEPETPEPGAAASATGTLTSAVIMHALRAGGLLQTVSRLPSAAAAGDSPDANLSSESSAAASGAQTARTVSFAAGVELRRAVSDGALHQDRHRSGTASAAPHSKPTHARSKSFANIEKYIRRGTHSGAASVHHHS